MGANRVAVALTLAALALAPGRTDWRLVVFTAKSKQFIGAGNPVLVHFALAAFLWFCKVMKKMTKKS